jgi:hypothetical protein
LIGSLSRKKNWNEFAGVLYRFGSKLPDPITRKLPGMVLVRIEDQTVEGKDPKWRSVINICGRKDAVSERERG